MKRALCGTIALGFGVLALSPPAFASAKGRKNTAIGLTAASIYLLAKDKDTAGLVGAAGSAYAWKRYNDAHKKEVAKRSYRQGYYAGRSTNSGGTYRSSRGYTSSHSQPEYVASRSQSQPAASRTAAAGVKPALSPVAQANAPVMTTPSLALAVNPATPVGQSAAFASGLAALTPAALGGAPPAAFGLESPSLTTNKSALWPWALAIGTFILGIGATLLATGISRNRTDDGRPGVVRIGSGQR